ncbi:tetratricopeptide repeat protein (plasmid) [Streptomyces viridifaciens]|nr:tetratricopeptide repeat protein [Streptomyces viridifaciens]
MVGTGGEALVRYRLLGPVRAHRQQAELELGPAKQRAVLAVLLLNDNRLLAREEIIDAVWGSRPPAGASGLVATYVARLRKVLEPARARRSPANELVSRGTSYGMMIAREQLDLRVFEELLVRARGARERGDLRGCSAALGRALELWRGTPLEGLPGAYAEVHRRRLGDLRLAAQEDRCEVALDQGLHQEVAAELSALAAAHPHRERVRELLMLALHRSGRSAEALAVFQDTWRTLTERSGIEPSPALRRLQRAILDADPALDLRPVVQPIRTRDVPAQLPPDIVDFTGRAAEVAAVREVVDTLPDAVAAEEHQSGSAVPVVVITGPGGVGKSTLAVHVAHRLREGFPDGQLHLHMGGLRDRPHPPAEMLERVLADLGVPAERIPANLEQRTALYRTVTSGRRLLVVLDDARDAAQVKPLLPGSPTCTVLVTSRSRLADLPVARTLSLATLDDAESLRLLEKIVGAETVAADLDAATRLVEICAGLPLALRVVGARAGGRPAGALRRLAGRLLREEHRLGELRAGGLAVTASFQVSYDSLLHTPVGAEAARAFRLLSCLAAPDLGLGTAAAALDLTEERAEDLLELLCDFHLLQYGAAQDAHRYRYHDLLRLFAQEVSGATETPADIAQSLARVVDAHLTAVVDADELLRPGHQREAGCEASAAGPALQRFVGPSAALRWLESERAAIVSVALQAAGHGAVRPDQLAELTTRLRAFLQRRGHWTDWELLATATVEAAGDSDCWARAAAIGHLELGTLASTRHRFAQAVAELRLSVELFGRTGDELRQGRALNNLGVVYIETGRHQEAADCLERALAVQRARGSELDAAITLDNLGLLHLRRGAREEASAHCLESIAFHRAGASAELASAPLNILGLVRCEQGRLDEAIALQFESRDLARMQGNLYREALALLDLAEAYRRQGELRQAVDCAEQGLEIRRRLGDPYGTGQAFARLGAALDTSGQRDRARACWSAAAEALDATAPSEAAAIRKRLVAH